MSVTASRPETLREEELSSIISSYMEVTERLKTSHEKLTGEVVRLRDQLAEKNRELARKRHLASLGEMAAGVAHEIRNPLGGIQLFASLLERDLADQPKLQQLAAKISGGVSTLEGIVSDILTFAGRGEVTLEPVRLAVVVVEALELVAPRRSALQAEMHVDPVELDVTVEANAVQLQRALLNLLFNALDAAGQGGNVWLTCTEDQDEEVVRVVVADDGPGVAPELVQKIFDPFFSSKDSGTGLGLGIVHRIAESHGGAVRVSDRPGGGAVFTLTLRSAAIEAAAVCQGEQ